MAEQKIRTDFNAMIVAELKKCLQEHSIPPRLRGRTIGCASGSIFQKKTKPPPQTNQ